MKNLFKSLVLSSVCVFLANVEANAQNKVPDKPWIKENTPTRKVVPYTHVREADVQWHRRVWRMLDLREKINHPLYYPIVAIQDRKSLFDVIKTAVLEGTITSYDAQDDEFLTPLTKSEAMAQMGDTTVILEEDEWGDPTIEKKTYTEVESQDIVNFRIKEDWFFDRERSIMDVRIIGVAPVKNVIDPNTGEYRGKKTLFWIYFPEARYVFANYDVFNRQNDAERRTYDDIFWKRMFSSYVYKRSNVYDRQLNQHKSDIDLLLEAEKIKEEIFNYEHDLWHY